MDLLVAALAALIVPPAHAAGLTQWITNGVAVCTAAGNQQNPQLVADGAGGAIVTWQDRRGATLDDIYALRLRADGTPAPGWPANGVALCTAPFPQSVPQIASDGAGGAIVTWQDGRASGTNDIYAQHVLAGGTVDPAWPANGAALCTATGSQGIPQIVADGQGGAIVAWQDPRNGNTDIYAQRVLANGTVDPAWPVDGLPVCVALRTQSNPRMASDGGGGAIITWQDSRNGSPLQEVYDIYAQRVRVTGQPAWAVNGVALCLAYSNQLSPQIIADGAGGAIVTWYDRRFGQPIDPIFQDIFAQRVNAAGVTQWTTDGAVVCTAVSTQAGQVITSDGAGGAIIAWQDYRSDVSWDIYAQHMQADSTIAPGWPVNGVAVSSANSSQETPQIVSDGAGGAIVTWFNVISPPAFGPVYRDIYAERVLANGTIAPGWLLDGIAVCAADSTQQNPQIVTDGAGGAIITWQDSRSAGANPLDIYAQRVNDHPCATASALALLQSCGVVDWTRATGGAFDDMANWNGGAGPVPSGLCPASCTLYDARFGIGGAAYDVSFSIAATSATVTVAAGDHPTFHLAGSTYQMSDLHVEGAGSALTVEGGKVAVEGAIQIGQSAEAARRLPAAPVGAQAGAPAGASSFNVAAKGNATLSGSGAPQGIVFEPGGALISVAPIPYDLTNSGTLSPGAETDGVGEIESSASFTQSPGGTLVVDLGGSSPGTGYDALHIAGPATLHGTLAWKLVGGYLPAIGQEFEVLVAHPRTGVFDSVAVDIGISYTDTSVVLTAIPTTPVLASLVSAEADPGRVRVRWFVSGTGAPVSLYRARGRGGWEPLGSEFPDGTGMLSYEDLDVSPGRYGYRLGLPSDGGEIAAGEVWVDVPATGGFGLRGVSPNPAHGPLTVSFSLGGGEPAVLELFDPSGRRLQSRPIDAPRPGNRVLTLSAGRELGSGVYLLRLSQGARRATCRVAVVR